MSQGEFNPYEAPVAEVGLPGVEAQADDHVWRDGKTVVARRGEKFPTRCVKCNAGVSGPVKQRTFYWHSPWLFLLLLLNIVVYAIVATIVRKKSDHAVALCAAHRKRRNVFILVGWSSVIAAPALGILVGGEAGFLLGLVSFLMLMMTGIIGARILTPRRIDDAHARFGGAGEAFLASLPRAPSALRS